MIRVVPHDPQWAVRFEELAQVYRRALAAAGARWISIEHVGSTAVPGLAAKPVIDVDIVVEPSGVEAAGRALLGLGFTAEGERGIAQRWSFRQPELPVTGSEGPGAADAGSAGAGAITARTNTYVVVAGSLALRNHVAVRDALRADEGLRREYAQVKQRLAGEVSDIDEYVLGKSALLQRILTLGGLTESELDQVEASQARPGGPDLGRGEGDRTGAPKRAEP